MSVDSIALSDFAAGRRRQYHGFRDDKSNHPCCDLCKTRPMVSKQQMRDHENGRRHQENYERYLRVLDEQEKQQRRLALINPQYERVERMLAIKHLQVHDGKDFWFGDMLRFKAAAFDWIYGEDGSDYDDKNRLFVPVQRAWEEHINRTRMDLLLLSFVKMKITHDFSSLHAAKEDCIMMEQVGLAGGSPSQLWINLLRSAASSGYILTSLVLPYFKLQANDRGGIMHIGSAIIVV